LKPHEAWLEKARHDLNSARKLFLGADPVLDTAVYHTQQCAEKALKAFLAFHSQPVKKTHDLDELVDLCVEIDPAFGELYDPVEELNPYSVVFRYPAEVMEPEKDEVAEAIRLSEKVLQFIETKIKN
jgi:HEPN domain-containing protein